MPAIRRQHFRRLALIAAFFLSGTAPVLAQTGSGTAPSGITLPGSSGQTCVQVKVAGENPSPYNCLNQELQQQVAGASPPQENLPLSATSPSNAVGIFNKQGVAEQYGQNFGKSVIPFRPSAPVFNSSLAPPSR